MSQIIETTIRVRVIDKAVPPTDPSAWAHQIAQHLWNTFNDDQSLVQITFVPADHTFERPA